MHVHVIFTISTVINYYKSYCIVNLSVAIWSTISECCSSQNQQIVTPIRYAQFKYIVEYFVFNLSGQTKYYHYVILNLRDKCVIHKNITWTANESYTFCLLVVYRWESCRIFLLMEIDSNKLCGYYNFWVVFENRLYWQEGKKIIETIITIVTTTTLMYIMQLVQKVLVGQARRTQQKQMDYNWFSQDKRMADELRRHENNSAYLLLPFPESNWSNISDMINVSLLRMGYEKYYQR